MASDREARYSALFREHHAPVWRYVARRAWPDAVDDIVAETFLVAWRRFDDVPADPLPWLYTTAGKTLANHRRAASRGDALIARLRAQPRPAELDPGAGAERRAALVRAFAQLSDAERELLMLTDWDDLPARRAARTVDLTSAGARARIYRARRKLRRALAAELDERVTTNPYTRSADETA